MWISPITHLEEAGSWEWTPDHMALWDIGGFDESVSAFSTCLDVGIFLITPRVGVTQLVSAFLSEIIAPRIAVH